MKKMRKFVAVILALVMCFAMALPAMAAELGSQSNFTITISNNDNNQSAYEAYQIFKGDYAELNGEKILSNIDWGSGIDQSKMADLMRDIQALSGDFATCTTAADVAKALGAEGNAEESETASKFADIVNKYLSGVKTDSVYADSKYTISGLAAGYYLVKDQANSVGDGEAYTKFMLEVVDDAEATPKTDVPSADKKVKENEKYKEDDGFGEGYNDVADYNIGDEVPFAFYSKVPDTTYYDTYTFVFHDTLSKGLTFNAESLKVYVGDDELKNDSGHQIYTVNTTADGFTVTFNDFINDIAKSYSIDTPIRIEYTATLNADAEIGLQGNTNEMYLEYSNNPNVDTDKGTTPPDKVIVFTYELDTTKVDGAAKETKLQDAEFVLYKEVDGDRVYAIVKDGKLTGWTDPVEIGADGKYTVPEAATTLVSDENGFFKVAGLDDGTYYLQETKAPAGYNLPDHDFKLDITATTVNGQEWDGTTGSALKGLTLTVDTGEAENGDINEGTVDATIENNKGSLLPSTGGIGTTIFYVVGICLVVGAVVILVTRKRVGKNS